MSNQGVNIYKLKNGNTPNTYAIRHYGVMIETQEGLKEIGYYPGGSSIFANDNKKRQKSSIIFEFNGADATEFVAPKTDVVLNKYLQAHPDFNKDFEIFSKELQTEKELARFEKIEKALEKINETDSVKIKAMALAIYGIDAYGVSETAANAMLKKTAITEPEVILLKMEHANYEYQFLSAHAFFAGVVKENEHKNAVIWNDDTMGTILHLATGETGIYKLAEILAVNDMEARKITQAIGERLMNKTTSSGTQTTVNSGPDAKDDQIADLQRQLAAMQNATANAAPINVVNPVIVNSDNTPPVIEGKKEEDLGAGASEEAKKTETISNEALLELQQAYKTKFGRDVPPVCKNRPEWIQSKLNEVTE